MNGCQNGRVSSMKSRPAIPVLIARMSASARQEKPRSPARTEPQNGWGCASDVVLEEVMAADSTWRGTAHCLTRQAAPEPDEASHLRAGHSQPRFAKRVTRPIASAHSSMDA